jgi:hypothetical protein
MNLSGLVCRRTKKIVTMTDRGCLSPQRGEGSRVRGGITQVVEKQPNLLAAHGMTIHAGNGKSFSVFRVFRGEEMQI